MLTPPFAVAEMTRCEHHSACCRLRRLHAGTTLRRCASTRLERNTGMTFSAAAVWALLLATSCCAAPEQRRRSASAADSGVYMPELEDQVDLAEMLDQGEQELDDSENEAARLQKFASLLSVLRSTLNERQLQQQQQYGQAAAEDDSPVPGGYPALLPLIKDDDKRGSYMSLCHFKICNMGRKRNLPWSPFVRL